MSNGPPWLPIKDGLFVMRRNKKGKMESIFLRTKLYGPIWLLSVYCLGFLYLQFTASCHFLLVVVAETMDETFKRVQQQQNLVYTQE